MTSDANTKRLDCGDTVDIISNLPSDIINLTQKRLPIHDAARMSVLSKTWRRRWVMHPYLVFDNGFLNRLLSKNFPNRSRETEQYEFTKTISGILLAHSGPILKFCLDIPRDLPLHLHPDINFWIKCISNNGVRKVKLNNWSTRAYTIPSYLFSCSELTHLRLDLCILTPPPKFECFRNLISVRLSGVTITTDMSFGAQLVELDLQGCTGIEHLGCQFKSYINLTLLIIVECGEIDWQWFECSRKVNYLTLILGCAAKNIYDLGKLVDNMPKISTLNVDCFFLKFSEPGAAMVKGAIPTMESLKCLYFTHVEFYDLVQIKNVICLIRMSPNLQFLMIDQEAKVKSGNGINLADSRELMVASVEQYLQSPNLIDLNFKQLASIHIFLAVVNSAELHFIKVLLASSPSLRLMEIGVTNYTEDTLRISRELMNFPRASTTAEIKWT